MHTKPILCLDFDGVCHSYTSGWQGATCIPDAPVSGLFEFLEAAAESFTIAIYSARSHQEGGREAMQTWFEDQLCTRWIETGNRELCRNVQLTFPKEKPPARVTLDDRALTFTGTWPAVEVLKTFKPWNK